MYDLLTSTQANIPHFSELGEENCQNLQELAELFGDHEPRLLHAFWVMSLQYGHGAQFFDEQKIDMDIAAKLQGFGILELDEKSGTGVGFHDKIFIISDDGKKFLVRLKLEKGSEQTDKYIYRVDF